MNPFDEKFEIINNTYKNYGIGDIIYDKNLKLIFIKSKAKWIPITNLQLENRKIVNAHEFYVGQQMIKGKKLKCETTS
jgi:methionyl-tRNA formyltransferase